MIHRKNRSLAFPTDRLQERVRPRGFRPTSEVLEGRTLLAHAGLLDPSFGVGGIVRPVSSPSTTVFSPSIAVRSSSAGFLVGSENARLGRLSFAVEAYQADGSPDLTFGNEGVVSITLPEGDTIPAVSGLSSNPLLIANGTGFDLIATVDTASGTPMILVEQLESDGTPDPSFGTNGQALIDTSSLAPGFLVQGAALEANRIIVGGSFSLNVGGTQGHALALVGLTLAGQVDPSFATGGSATFSTIGVPTAPDAIPNETLTSLVATPEGGLVVVAQGALPGTKGSQTEVFKFQASGPFDFSFGNLHGFVTFDNTTVAQYVSAVAQPDGKIDLLGTGPGDSSIGLPSEVTRLNVDGSTDTTHLFNAPGQTFRAQFFALDDEGGLVVAGPASGVTQGANPFAVIRLLSDLTPDPTFGVYQGASPFQPLVGVGNLEGLAIDSIGNILVSGYEAQPVVMPVQRFFARLLATPSTTAPATPTSDLSITLTSTSPTPSVGAVQRVNLTVTNRGPVDATNVTVTDTLPSGARSFGVVSSQGGSLGESSDFLGTIPAGGSATLTFSFSPGTSGTATNMVQVSGDQADPEPTNNTVIQTLNVLPAPDLSLVETMIGDGKAGDIQLFSLIVTNNGPLAATGVELIDALPTESVILNVASTQGSVTSQSQGQVTVGLGRIEPGGSATVVIVYVPQGFGIFVNAGLVANDAPDPIPDNNFAILGQFIPESADIDVRQTMSGDRTSGDLQFFTVTVTNKGNVPVNNVILADALPSNALITQISPSRGIVQSVANGLATISLFELFPGEVATVVIGYVPRGPGASINLAAAGGDLFDEKPVNNFSYEAAVAFDGPYVAGLAQTKDRSALVLNFDESLDLASAQTLANYHLFDLGTTSTHSNPKAVTLKSAVADPKVLNVKITPSQLLPGHSYKLTIDGTSTTGLIDFLGHKLDGAYTGRPGSDYSVIFGARKLPLVKS